jgi:hypothetical protein
VITSQEMEKSKLNYPQIKASFLTFLESEFFLRVKSEPSEVKEINENVKSKRRKTASFTQHKTGAFFKLFVIPFLDSKKQQEPWSFKISALL